MTRKSEGGFNRSLQRLQTPEPGAVKRTRAHAWDALATRTRWGSLAHTCAHLRALTRELEGLDLKPRSHAHDALLLDRVGRCVALAGR